MKKIFYILLMIVVLGVLLLGCEQTPSGIDNTLESVSESSTEDVGESLSEAEMMPNQADSLDELGLLELEENDIRLEYIRAFVSGDSARLEEICGVEDGLYDAYARLVIPRWFAYTETDQHGSAAVRFAFAISGDSEIKVFSPDSLNTGYTIVETINGAALEREPDFGAPESEAAVFLNAFLNRGFTDIPSSNEMTGYQRWNLTCYLIGRFADGGSLTLDEMQKYAKLVCGIDGFVPDDTHLRDGVYLEVGHGGWGQDLRIITEEKLSNEMYEITVDFYADPSKTIVSQSRTYTVEKADGEWVFRYNKQEVQISDQDITSLMDRYLLHEAYTVYASDMLSVDSAVKDKSGMFFKVTDEKYDTWDEWTAFCESIFCEDMLKNEMKRSEEHIKNVDGYTYCQSGSMGWPLSNKYTHEIIETTPEHTVIKITREEVKIGASEITERNYYFHMKLTDNGWRIVDIIADADYLS